MNTLFNTKEWKNKYDVSWCTACESAIIECKKCLNSSCSGLNCNDCKDDFLEYNSIVKNKVESYLSEDEIKVFNKIKKLKRFIIESVRDSKTEIDWIALDFKLKESNSLYIDLTSQ